MSGQKPFFLTGANAKIRVNGVVLAFCTNIAYSITVNHATPILLGMYESSSVEPLSYDVSGSFSIIKYTAGIKSDISSNMPGVSDRGNGIGAWGPEGTINQLKAGLKLSGADGRAYDNLNPKSLEKGTTFDIEIYQQFNGDSNTRSVAKIRNCRIVKADFNMSKRGMAQQNFQFKALYADEDTFIADFSGLGQQLG